MPRVYYVKKARKKNLVVDVGEPYFWWKHAFSPKQFSKTQPKQSQLTQSGFLSEFYSIQEDIEANMWGFGSLQEALDDIKQRFEDLKDQCEESLENMPEHLRDTSSSGETLTERIDALEESVSNLDSIEVPEEPSNWADEIQDYEEMKTDYEKTEAKENWRIEKADEFMQELTDNSPQL